MFDCTLVCLLIHIDGWKKIALPFLVKFKSMTKGVIIVFLFSHYKHSELTTYNVRSLHDAHQPLQVSTPHTDVDFVNSQMSSPCSTRLFSHTHTHVREVHHILRCIGRARRPKLPSYTQQNNIIRQSRKHYKEKLRN